MGKLSSLLWGAALGAGVMYFTDSQNGNRRKAMVRDRVVRMRNQADEGLDTAVNDLRHRVRGVLADGMAMVSEEGVPDTVLEERVRSRLGFLSRHPGAIRVTVEGRRAMLSGDILAEEVDHLMKGIGRVRGVKDVVNNLNVHQDAGNIPQLQGEGWLPGQDSQGLWSPSTRLLAGIGGGYLLLYGMARGGIIGTLAQLGGAVLGTRALTNMNFQQMTGSQEGQGIRVRKTIHINAPVEDVYALWSNFENFSRFMANVDTINNMGSGRSHWVVKGPAGSKVEFDALETENIPNEVVAWQTTPDSQVKHQGQVRFRPEGRNGTQVNVNMTYTPPAGVAGHVVATLFGKDPKSEMDADLARMKSLLEEGRTSAERQRVTRDQVMPVTGPSNQGDQSGQGGRSGRKGGRRNQNQGGNQGDTEGGVSDQELGAAGGMMAGDVSGSGIIPNTGDLGIINTDDQSEDISTRDLGMGNPDMDDPDMRGHDELGGSRMGGVMGEDEDMDTSGDFDPRSPRDL